MGPWCLARWSLVYVTLVLGTLVLSLYASGDLGLWDNSAFNLVTRYVSADLAPATHISNTFLSIVDDLC